MIPGDAATARIGTSGIVLPGSKSTFPPEFATATRLTYYASLFNTLEVNSSFYKIPMASTFAKWADEVPAEFKFSVKLWRGVTHAKKLNYLPDDIDKFMKAANQLGSRSGCLLIQFPASIQVDYLGRVEEIIQRVTQCDINNQWQLAVEFRHNSWYSRSVYKILEKYKASIVIHDMPASATPDDYQPERLAYFRYHGPSGTYRDTYNEKFMAEQAAKMQLLMQRGCKIYSYFNNTIDGALPNAQQLQALLTP